MGIAHARNERGFPRASVTCDQCGYQDAIPAGVERARSVTSAEREVLTGQVMRKLTARGWTAIKGVLRCPSCEAARKVKGNSNEGGTVRREILRRSEASPVEAVPAEAEPTTAIAAALIAAKRPKLSLNLGAAAPVSDAVEIPQAPSEPNGRQKRLIILALEDAYDDTAKNYRKGRSDQTVAAECGDGISPEWVAQIRDEMFGPAGPQIDAASLHKALAEIQRGQADAKAEMQRQSDALTGLTTDILAAKVGLQALQDRLARYGTHRREAAKAFESLELRVSEIARQIAEVTGKAV